MKRIALPLFALRFAVPAGAAYSQAYLDSYIRSELAKFAKVVKESGARID